MTMVPCVRVASYDTAIVFRNFDLNFYSCRSFIRSKIYLAFYCFKLNYRVVAFN